MPKKAVKKEIPNLETEKDADERRLFYVALTRAKEGITISYSENDGNRELLPSIFLNELKSDLVEQLDGKIYNERYHQDIAFQFGAPQELPHINKNSTQEHIQSFVADLFEKQGLSPTALNNYLECPWKYFYQNLIRIPATPNKHMQYGTAIHGALEDFFNYMKSEGESKTYLLSAFENRLNQQKIDKRDREDLFKKGNESLAGWFDTYTGTWNIPSQTELNIRGVQLQEGVKINGKLDRVEFVEDAIVNVIDYKTGKPKSRNQLMGVTKNSDGNYYRQITFYKLLLKYYKEGQWAFQSGVIDFIEPDEKGKYHREVFEISDQEVQELEQHIIAIADDIVHLKFWNTTCDNKDCEFCKLRTLMK